MLISTQKHSLKKHCKVRFIYCDCTVSIMKQFSMPVFGKINHINIYAILKTAFAFIGKINHINIYAILKTAFASSGRGAPSVPWSLEMRATPR